MCILRIAVVEYIIFRCLVLWCSFLWRVSDLRVSLYRIDRIFRVLSEEVFSRPNQRMKLVSRSRGAVESSPLEWELGNECGALKCEGRKQMESIKWE